MIDLTPLDVRKKRGDFARVLRGYEVQHVDAFLELVAERLEELVKENLTLTERVARLSEQVDAQTGRERAVNDALVTAQQLREEIANAAEREADVIRRQAQAEADQTRSRTEAEAERVVAEARVRVAEIERDLREFERRRSRFLATFRHFLEREIDAIEVQEGRGMEGESVVDLDLRGPRRDFDLETDAEAISTEPLGVFDPVEEVPPLSEDADDRGSGLPIPDGDDEREISPPRPDADIHDLASDSRLASDPHLASDSHLPSDSADSGLDWLESRDDDER